MSLLPVDLLERDWLRELAGPVLSEHMRQWRAQEPALRPFERPMSLLGYLGPATPARGKDVVLCALLRRAREDPLAARVVLQTLLPGLKRRFARILIDADEREELWSMLLERAWVRIRDYPVARLPWHIAGNLTLSAMRDVLRTLEKEGERASSTAGEPSGAIPDRDQGVGDIDALLDAAAYAGAISVEEAELIARTRIDRVPLSQCARSAGVAYDALRVRRRRAERRLLLHLGVRDVRFGGSKRPVCSARVAGAGLSGSAGAANHPSPSEEVNRGPLPDAGPERS